MADEIVIGYIPNKVRLSRALETEDLLGAVQRGHAEVNDALAHVLTTIINWCDLNKKVPHEFGAKIKMLRKYCNIPVRIRPLELLNDIRNPLMKDGIETIDPLKLEGLFDAVSEMYGRRLTRDFIESKRDTSSGLMVERRYAEMSDAHKIAFLSAMLMFGIAAIPEEIKEKALTTQGILLG